MPVEVNAPSAAEQAFVLPDTASVDDIDLREEVSDALKRLPEATKRYIADLFPIAKWIPHYNLRWALGDAIAGFTIGLMVVPQALSYAKLAGLPPEYGLYSSFIGVMIYCLFATSKDVTIGPTAVMALTTGQVLARISSDSSNTALNVALATTLAFLAGCIMLGIGLFRLGFILDFIPNPVIAGFTTGGAVTVVITQIPGLFGIKNVDTRTDTYLVIGNIFKNIGTANWVDCLFGLISVAGLVGIKQAARRWGNKSLLLWWIGVARFAIVCLIAILVSWLINRTHPSSPSNSILKTVPSGFTYVAVPPLGNSTVVNAALSGLPVIVLLALLEHISIAKSFGRINGYKVNPSQESVAIGVTNIAASFFGGFPSTGSFSRTAIKSQAGVRTPLAGIVTGLIVILAIFVLAPFFYWIPSATLSAIIMHGVTELVSPPSYFKRLWAISRLDFLITFVTIVLSIIMTIELAIEVAVALALALLLIRIAFPSYSVLVRDTTSGEWTSIKEVQATKKRYLVASPGVLIFRPEESLIYPNSNRIRNEVYDVISAVTKDQTPSSVTIAGRAQKGKSWNEYGGKWSRQDVDPEFAEVVSGVLSEWQRNAGVAAPVPGIEVTIDKTAYAEDKQAAPINGNSLAVPDYDPLANSGAKSTVSTAFSAGLQASESPLTGGATSVKPSFANDDLPSLRAIIFDFSAVNTIDSTGAQTLLDLLTDANRRSGGAGVQMHFVHTRRHVRRVLERSGVIAAQIPVPVKEDGGVKLERIEIAVEGVPENNAGRGLNFNALRTIKGLRFPKFGTTKEEPEERDLAEADIEAGIAVPADQQGAAAGAAIAVDPATEAAVSDAEAHLDAEQVIIASHKYVAQFIHGNLDDAVEAIDEFDKRRSA